MPQAQSRKTVLTTPPQPRVDGNAILQQLIKENPGFAKIYNPNNTAVTFAPPERVAQLQKAGMGDNQLEYWPPGEKGSPDFPRPPGHEGKHVLEIYKPSLQTNPSELKKALYGDLLHGMAKDPGFADLRNQFIQNYPPHVSQFNSQYQEKTGASMDSIHDMYIRGRLAANQGAEWNDPARYSPKQLEILSKMKKYISGGSTILTK